MSNILQAKCWPLQMKPTNKSVLISLADNSSDEGHCWPSIRYICMRTCLAERTVHASIRWLESVGLLIADRSNGRHTRYIVTPDCYKPPQELRPRKDCAPAADAVKPPQILHQPPQIVQEPPQELRSNHHIKQSLKATISKATIKKRPGTPERPPDVSEQIWADWLLLRKDRRAPVTVTVLNNARREANKAGLTLEHFLEIWCVRGSTGLQADWLKPSERAGPQIKPAASHPKSRTLTAIETLQAMKNGHMDSSRDFGRNEQTALLGPGTDSGC